MLNKPDARKRGVGSKSANPRVMLFDSGLGGLSVLSEIQKLCPSIEVDYVADDAAFPYGAWAEGKLVDHIVDLIGRLIAKHRPELVVIACNTASTLVLPPLREKFALPFVGTVPAIKPAALNTKSGLITVIATPGTVTRDYTQSLIHEYARDVIVELVGSEKLAGLAEAVLSGEIVDDETIYAEIAHCFRQIGGARTDTIVLGCTHYPLLLDRFIKVAPWNVDWIDPAPAIARRVAAILGIDNCSHPFLSNASDGLPSIAESSMYFTSSKSPSSELVSTLKRFYLRVANA